MPNFLTVENQSQVAPISWKQKFVITARGSFDPYEFVVVGVLAGIRQAENAYPGFGQGFVGYTKRYGAAFADQVDGNIMVGGVFPTILKTDPRYFQLGKGEIHLSLWLCHQPYLHHTERFGRTIVQLSRVRRKCCSDRHFQHLLSGRGP